MAKQLGRVQTLTFNSSNVLGIVDGSYDLSRAKIDVTTHDTGDAKEYLQAQLEGSISLTCKYDGADTGQQAIRAALAAGTSYAVDFRGITAGSAEKFTGTAIVEKISGKYPTSDAAEFTCDLTFSGTVTRGAQ